MIRLAYFSPLNPIPSGISDYSEELLPLLARELFADIELFVDDFTPSNPTLSRFPIHPLREFTRGARTGQFDLALYHMGNSPSHANIYKTLLAARCPSVVVLHDLVLHHLRAWQTLERGDAKNYIEAMRADYGDAGADLARLEARGLAQLDRFDYPLNGDVIRAARAIVVHSEYGARQIQSRVPNTPVAVIPMGVTAVPPFSIQSARASVNLPLDAFIIAAFGEVHPHKRVTVALEAFAEVHIRLPRSLFLLVGRESPNYDAEDVIASLKLQDAVRRIGFAPPDEYENYIAAADVCLNLRYPSAGETSASLLRLLSAGKAVVVTRTGAYADLPDSVVAKIDADEYEQSLLAAQLQFFAERPDVRAALGANARDFVAQCHTLEQSAAAYADFLRAVVEGRAVSKSYLKRWTGDRFAGQRTLKAITERRSFDMTQDKLLTSKIQPPSSVPRPMVDDFRDSLARDYAELGFDADDPTLRAVARAMVELGLSGEEPT